MKTRISWASGFQNLGNLNFQKDVIIVPLFSEVVIEYNCSKFINFNLLFFYSYPLLCTQKGFIKTQVLLVTPLTS